MRVGDLVTLSAAALNRDTLYLWDKRMPENIRKPKPIGMIVEVSKGRINRGVKMKIDAYDVAAPLVIFAVSITTILWTQHNMSKSFDEDWAAHSAEQCAPYGVYHSKVSDFSYKCSETLVDSQPETR